MPNAIMALCFLPEKIIKEDLVMFATVIKNKLENFFDRLSIRNKIMAACLPFMLISYVILFASVTLIMYQQMKSQVYSQTRQNIIEKANLLNTTLNTYDQITTNFLYYDQDTLDYLVTDKKEMSDKYVDIMEQNIRSEIASKITDNNPEITQVALVDKFNQIYVNNAIYSNTLSTIQSSINYLHPLAANNHGQLTIADNPEKALLLSISRVVNTPSLEHCDEEIGFLILDIPKAFLKTQLEVQENNHATYMLLLDKDGKILVNASDLSSLECQEIISAQKRTKYDVIECALSYSNCKVVSIIDESVLFKDTYHLFILEVCMLFISTFIMLLSIIFSANMISKQIATFITKLNHTQRIDENAYIHIASRDEFHELGEVYNKMISRIDRLIQTVYLKEITTKNAQLESLQAQINPHFLYNTLDCINSLIEIGEKQNVQKVVTSLASIMRMSIKGNSYITLAEDLSYIEQYIFIQKMRFRNKVLFLTEVPASLQKYYVPKLILQPLVENAIVHGISELKETGMIGIFGYEDETRLFITIEDNGYGIPKEIVAQLASTCSSAELSNAHIGIFNIQKRLKILYGDCYGLTIESLHPHGSSVTICIPKITEPIKNSPFERTCLHNEDINC